MDNLLIIGILVLILVAATVSVVKKSRTKGSCCSGSAYVAKSRKLKTVTGKITLHVEGMSCQHCVNRVMEAVQDIPHTSAVVHLKKGIVVVSIEEPVDPALIKAAIEKQGYSVTDMV